MIVIIINPKLFIFRRYSVGKVIALCRSRSNSGFTTDTRVQWDFDTGLCILYCTLVPSQQSREGIVIAVILTAGPTL